MSKRIHLSLRVTDLAASTRFYSELLGAPPDLVRADHVKWRVDSPPLNLAISPAATAAVDHLGIENSEVTELDSYLERFGERSDAVAEAQAQCCYARSDKLWVRSPDALSWELFQTHQAETDDTGDAAKPQSAATAPAPVTQPGRPGGGCC
ncbi:MAG: glyoxalase/bleomycin resistance/dioxygenase family protein [Pseudomonadota bacterium]